MAKVEGIMSWSWGWDAEHHGEASAVLTDEHASSSYGIPVLVIAGQPYGPRDLLPSSPVAARHGIFDYTRPPMPPDTGPDDLMEWLSTPPTPEEAAYSGRLKDIQALLARWESQ